MVDLYKRKKQVPEKPYEPQGYDNCQTPNYALKPLLPYLDKVFPIWESACGYDRSIQRYLESLGYNVLGTDLIYGNEWNFFDFQPGPFWSVQITNPPYSIKYKWLERSYELNTPFALLLPVETLGAAKAQKLFSKHGIEIILLDKRINFKMPNLGYSGKGSHFSTAWFTHNLNIGKEISYAHIESNKYNG